MKITILGSGSKGNSTIIETENSALMIDAGFSFKETRRRMLNSQIDESKLKAVLVTHEHADHINCLKTINRILDVDVYANSRTAEAIRAKKNKAPERFNIFMTGEAFSIGEFLVEPFSVPHDAADPVAYVVTVDGKRAAFVTDIGHVGILVIHKLRNCNFIMLESNHDVRMLQDANRPWSLKKRIVGRFGHLSNETTMQIIPEVVTDETQAVVFAHASMDCNSYKLIEDSAQACFNALPTSNAKFYIAEQDKTISLTI